MARKLKPPKESSDQIALVHWFRLQYPNEVLFCIPNQLLRPNNARYMALQGVIAGMPDLMLASANKRYHGLYIELKRAKGGVLSANQAEMIFKLNNAGYLAVVCHGFEQARQAILAYMQDKD